MAQNYYNGTVSVISFIPIISMEMQKIVIFLLEYSIM